VNTHRACFFGHELLVIVVVQKHHHDVVCTFTRYVISATGFIEHSHITYAERAPTIHTFTMKHCRHVIVYVTTALAQHISAVVAWPCPCRLMPYPPELLQLIAPGMHGAIFLPSVGSSSLASSLAGG
jgi:hypothetical protein